MIKKFERYINDNSNITTEEERTLKFRIGDIVRINVVPDELFKIVSIDTGSSSNVNINGKIVQQPEYYLNFYPSDQARSWCAEYFLELVPDYELNALKYNL